MVFQDVVIYPSETPPSLGGPSRSSEEEHTCEQNGKGGVGGWGRQDTTQDAGFRTLGTEEETEVGGDGGGEGRKKRKARVRNNRQEAGEVEKDQV